MATTTKPVALDPARVSDIARQIRGAVTPFLGANATKMDASEALQAAANSETAMRETIMVNVADLSHSGQWSTGEIGAAAAKAAAMSNNDSEKALATFIGETKRAMHPFVRAHVPALIALRDMVWQSETEMRKADKDAPTPLRKAFARSYHLMIALFGEAAEGRVFTTAQDVLDFAAERDPDLDLDKVKKRLDAIRDQLVKFYADWPVDDIQVCIDALNEIDKRALKVSRGIADKVVSLPTKPATTVAHTPAPVPVPTTVVADTVREGPGDILDDILGTNLEMAA